MYRAIPFVNSIKTMTRSSKSTILDNIGQLNKIKIETQAPNIKSPPVVRHGRTWDVNRKSSTVLSVTQGKLIVELYSFENRTRDYFEVTPDTIFKIIHFTKIHPF